MSDRLRIKLGPMEVEYEGDQEFLRKELLNLIADITQLYREAGLQQLSSEASQEGELGRDGKPAEGVRGSTAEIAKRLSASSGGDLIMAAAAHLSLVKGRESFSRQDIIDEMRTVSSLFRRSYVSNLTSYLETLKDKGKLNEPRTNEFALMPDAKTDLEEQLAQ